MAGFVEGISLCTRCRTHSTDAPSFALCHHSLVENSGQGGIRMSAWNLIRWRALAAMLGGALSILFVFLGENNWAHVPVDAARYALLVVGIAGLYLYLRQSSGFGRLGTVGFYVCISVFALIAILDLGIIVNEEVEQTYIALGPVRGPLLLLGMLLFSAAELRAERLPHGGA